MTSKLTLEWFKAALIRALRTMAQVALGMFTVGMAIDEINWWHVVSVSVVAAVYSLLTSLATTLPEVGTDGTFNVDLSDPVKDKYLLTLNSDLDKVGSQKRVTLTVTNKHMDSQE